MSLPTVAIRETPSVQRNLSGLLFLVAGVMVSIALGAWWLQRTAFTPDVSSGRAAAVMQNDQIRAEITAVVTAASVGAVDTDPAELARFVDRVISSPPGGAVTAEIVADAHARLIGERQDPVRISGAQMVEIVRTQAVGDLAPVTLPVPEVAAFRVLGNTLGWVAAVSLVIGALAFLLGVIVRPERADVLRGLAEWLLAMAVSLLVFGLLVPVFLIPAIDDSTWTGAIPRIALRQLPLLIGGSAVFVALGLFLLVRSLNAGRRKQWSTPLAVSRYREDRSWS